MPLELRSLGKLQASRERGADLQGTFRAIIVTASGERRVIPVDLVRPCDAPRSVYRERLVNELERADGFPVAGRIDRDGSVTLSF